MHMPFLRRRVSAVPIVRELQMIDEVCARLDRSVTELYRVLGVVGADVPPEVTGGGRRDAADADRAD